MKFFIVLLVSAYLTGCASTKVIDLSETLKGNSPDEFSIIDAKRVKHATVNIKTRSAVIHTSLEEAFSTVSNVLISQEMYRRAQVAKADKDKKLAAKTKKRNE